jgi:hypothetical protein
MGNMTVMRMFRTGVVAAAAAGMLLVGSAPAHAAIVASPGDQLSSDAGQCTANFVYSNGSTKFIGLAAHCFSKGGSTDTNGCSTTSMPLGSAVTNADGQTIGTLAYSSWLTMKGRHETDAETCDYNDLALVRLASGVTASPSVPKWGGPTGLAPAGAPESGNDVYSYGNSSLRLGITQLSPKTGTGIDDTPGGWSHTVYTVTPGIPGDSGSGFLDASGRAFGVLSTITLAPLAGSNGVGDLGKELAYATQYGGLGTITVVTGGAFNPGLPV